MSESAHAERYFMRNGKLFKSCGWKSIHHYRTNCEHVGCKEPATCVVGWKAERWYGSKICEEALCTIHGNEWREYLLKSRDPEDVSMRMIQEIPQWIPRVRLTRKQIEEAEEYWDD